MIVTECSNLNLKYCGHDLISFKGCKIRSDASHSVDVIKYGKFTLDILIMSIWNAWMGKLQVKNKSKI